MSAEQTVLITGGSGFIGQAIAAEARKHGYTVATFDRVDGQDVRDERAVDKAFTEHRPGTVIHLAGVLGTSELLTTPSLAADVNTYGTANILQACLKHQTRFLGISMPPAFSESLYTITKLAGIDMAKALHKQLGLPVAHVRAFNAFGPGQHVGGSSPRKILPAFACEAYLNRDLTVWGTGQQGVDLISTEQLARLFVRVLEDGQFEGETYDGGVGVGFSVNAVAFMVLNAVRRGAFHPGTTSQMTHLPMRLGETPTNIVAKGEGWDRIGWDESFDAVAFVKAVDSYHAVVEADPIGIATWLDESIAVSLPKTAR